jgi:hypothetical protein
VVGVVDEHPHHPPECPLQALPLLAQAGDLLGGQHQHVPVERRFPKLQDVLDDVSFHDLRLS